jgi:arylformamidase
MSFEPEDIIDLSNPIDHDVPVWPTLPPVELIRTGWAARDGATMERVEMATHTGTHVDSPRHFIPGGKTLDDYPLRKFVGRGVVLDLTPAAPGEPITVADLEQHEEQIREDDVVMLHNGWDEYYGRTPEYLFEWPYLTGESAQYLSELEPKAVGIDGMSVAGWGDEVPAHGPTTDVSAADSHVPLLENDVLPIEEVRNLGQVLEGRATRRAYFLYPPLNFQGTSGSSVRCFAFL